jgi:hypothetical protein
MTRKLAAMQHAEQWFLAAMQHAEQLFETLVPAGITDRH